MPKDREAGIELAIQACRKLVEVVDASDTCDLCGGGNDESGKTEHFDCPYVTAKKALQLLGLEK